MSGSTARFFCQKLVHFAHSVSLYFGLLFGFFFFRLQGDSSILLNKNDEIFNFVKTDNGTEEDDVVEFRQSDEEEEKPEVFLKFRFPRYEEFRQIQIERGNELNSEVVPSAIDGGQYELEKKFPFDEMNDSDKNILEESCVEAEEIGKIEEKAQTDHEEWFAQFCFGRDSYSDDFLSDMDLREETEINGQDLKMETDDHGGFPWDSMEDRINHQQNPEGLDSDFLSEQDFNEYSDNIDDEKFAGKTMDGGDESEDQESEDSDSLWEHQELIEQLKMELKKVKATGLPTILEESEASPKILMNDLKPWKMDEFRREDCIGELHKFYKSYRERMRKFDIVSYQKMYAMGCLQLKDPLQSLSKPKSSSPTFKSLLSQNLQLFKNKIHGTDPMKKFITELQNDLETVYVAHACLSWEFLQWQYEKALDLWDSDPLSIRRYNEVAGEFQQFQVLMQRFIEDEPFHGPRTQHYVNTRRIHRNLLQVPVIRQDKSRKERDEYVITSEMLVEILEESIRIFWRFIRADKDSVSVASNGHKKLPVVASPEDLELLMEAKKILQKKERKLGDVVRSESCILRKLRRRREDNEDNQVLRFFSQVDMRLVARALNMSNVTREQLMWCLNKLNRIGFVDRKIYVEPAFLLFPC